MAIKYQLSSLLRCIKRVGSRGARQTGTQPVAGQHSCINTTPSSQSYHFFFLPKVAYIRQLSGYGEVEIPGCRPYRETEALGDLGQWSNPPPPLVSTAWKGRTRRIWQQLATSLVLEPDTASRLCSFLGGQKAMGTCIPPTRFHGRRALLDRLLVFHSRRYLSRLCRSVSRPKTSILPSQV